MIVPNVIGPSYTVSSLNADCEECINLYLEKMESPGAKAGLVYCSTPGIAAGWSLNTDVNRALFTMNDRTFAVNGSDLYELFFDFTFTDWGAMASDASPATMCSNGDGGHQVFITSGGQGYIFDVDANTLTAVLVGCTQGGFLNGYFLALDALTATLKLSALEDGTSWDGTMVAQRSTAADRWIAMAVLHGEIWLFGSQTSEVWYDAGVATFPMAPIPGAFMEQGIAANFSIARLGNTLVWLSRNEQGQALVVQSNGYVPVRISTHAVEYAIQSYGTISDATAFAYQDQGHQFYVLNFPSAGVTWVYDSMTQVWHKRGYWNTDTGDWEAATPENHCFAFGTHLVGDRTTSIIYTQDVSLCVDRNGVPLRRLRRFPHLSQEQQWIGYNRLQIDCDVGIGASDGAPTYLSMRYSNDLAHTWSTERTASLGAIGEYLTRVRFLKLGRARDRVFELSYAGPGAPFRMVNAYLDITPGTS